jgi:hypothetical protein
MTALAHHVEDRQFRAPRGDRSVFADPPFDEVGELAAANVARRTEWAGYDFHGRTLAELSRLARSHLLDEARCWTSAYRDLGGRPADSSAPIFLAGHQPQLFHPGVWLKNFALGSLARRHGATAVNLVVDNDTAKGASLRVPGGPPDRPYWSEVPLDRSALGLPYEERPVLDGDLFAGFGARAADQIAALVPDPLLRKFWPLAVERARETGLLGASLAQARHALEGHWGLATLEVPLSRVCRSEAFHWFVAHLLMRLPRLRQVYNAAVGQYRRAHRIRNAAHPVPDLVDDGPWLEAPFWVWTQADPRRRPLLASKRRGQLVLSDRQSLELVLPMARGGNVSRTVQRLDEVARQGVKIRPRALMTTLFARLVLGDLFIHGIGGAKYDQVTDALVEGFFGLQPPRFMVLSATLHLPVEHRPAAPADARSIGRQLRELDWHPEKYLDLSDVDPGGVCACRNPAHLVAEKTRWVAASQTPQSARLRWQQIRRINEALQPWVACQRRLLRKQQVHTEQSLRARGILEWREYGFCLYPAETLRDFLGGLLPNHL